MVQTKNYLCRKTSLHPNANMSESNGEERKEKNEIHERECIKKSGSKARETRESKICRRKRSDVARSSCLIGYHLLSFQMFDS